MWILRGIFFLVLLIVLVLFFMENGNQTVDLEFFGREYLDINIFWLLLLSYLLGVVTIFVVAAVREFRTHRTIRKLQGELRSKEREIGDLRTLPLQDLGAGEEPEENGRE